MIITYLLLICFIAPPKERNAASGDNSARTPAMPTRAGAAAGNPFDTHRFLSRDEYQRITGLDLARHNTLPLIPTTSHSEKPTNAPPKAEPSAASGDNSADATKLAEDRKKSNLANFEAARRELYIPQSVKALGLDMPRYNPDPRAIPKKRLVLLSEKPATTDNATQPNSTPSSSSTAPAKPSKP